MRNEKPEKSDPTKGNEESFNNWPYLNEDLWAVSQRIQNSPLKEL